ITNPSAINQTGTYYISATNSNGCMVIKPVKVVINPLPNATISGPDSLCLGLNTNLTINLQGTGPWTIIYTEGNEQKIINNIQSNTYQLNVQPTQTTTFTLLSVADRNCMKELVGEDATHKLWITIPIDGI